MKLTKFITLGGLSALFIVCAVLAVMLTQNNESIAAAEKTFDDLYICAMHPQEASDAPGNCPICNMKLSPVEGHERGTPAPDAGGLYVSPSDFMYIHEGAGKDPQTGEDLIPMRESPLYAAPADEGAHNMDTMDANASPESEEVSAGPLWTCGMHPDVISDKPGICPICHMELIPLKGSTSAGGGVLIKIDPVTLQNIGVRTEAVQRRDLSKEILLNGIIAIAEDAQYKLNARVSGWVEKLYVSRTGDSVKKGQPLLEIYSPELVAVQEEYLQALQSAETLRRNGIVDSGSDLLSAARRRLELWDISSAQIDALEQSRKVSKTMTLISPADGIVMHKNVVEGSAIKPGMDLFFIVDLSEVWMQGQVYEYEAPWIHLGDEVKIVSPYDPNLSINGRIDYIYPTLDPKNRSLEIRVVLPNPELKWKPDMYVTAMISASPLKDVVSVQKSAVLRSGKRDIVFVGLGGGRFEPRQVHVGIETDFYYEIPYGLEAGEEVVLSAQFLLDSEAKLQEALQRRLRMRKETGTMGETSQETPDNAHAGHGL